MVGLWCCLLLVQLLHLSMDIHDLFGGVGGTQRPQMDGLRLFDGAEPRVMLSALLVVVLSLIRVIVTQESFFFPQAILAMGSPFTRFLAASQDCSLLEALVTHEPLVALFSMGVFAQMLCLNGASALLF